MNKLYKCIDGRTKTYPDRYGSAISFNSKTLAHTHIPIFIFGIKKLHLQLSAIQHSQTLGHVTTIFAVILNIQIQDIKQSRYDTKMTISLKEEQNTTMVMFILTFGCNIKVSLTN